MREFLKGLELDAGIVDKIMAEYGKRFSESNEDKELINALSDQVESLNKQIGGLNKEIEGYKSTIENKEQILKWVYE